jgi:hypothetical protein
MMFNKYAAGNKIYGGGRSAPNIGPVDPMGYKERDAKRRLQRNIALRKLKAKKEKRPFSADAMRPTNG